MRQCQAQERWAGLWDFPRFAVPDGIESTADFAARSVATQTGVEACVDEPLATIRYGVTRFRITLDCYQARFVRGRLRDTTVRWLEPKSAGRTTAERYRPQDQQAAD